MKPVPAEPLEDVIAERLMQLSKDSKLVTNMVKKAVSGSSEILGTLTQTKKRLVRQQGLVQKKIDALVESIADRKGIKSVGKKIVELEEQQEQLYGEVVEIDMQIDELKRKAVSADSVIKSLTTFEDFYRVATPEERHDLMRLQVNQLTWTPDEIKLALLDDVAMVQREGITGSPDVGFN